jgi:hypothetical protein
MGAGFATSARRDSNGDNGDIAHGREPSGSHLSDGAVILPPSPASDHARALGTERRVRGDPLVHRSRPGIGVNAPVLEFVQNENSATIEWPLRPGWIPAKVSENERAIAMAGSAKLVGAREPVRRDDAATDGMRAPPLCASRRRRGVVATGPQVATNSPPIALRRSAREQGSPRRHALPDQTADRWQRGRAVEVGPARRPGSRRAPAASRRGRTCRATGSAGALRA